MTLSIVDRVALVTGGARGIGAGIVGVLAQAGAKVMVADIGVSQTESASADDDNKWRYELADAADLQQSLAQGDNIKAVHVDVTSADSCAGAVAHCVSEFGQLDILINNAGIVDSGSIANFDPDSWDRIFAVNAKGIFLMTQASLPHLQASDQACIVNTASMAAKRSTSVKVA